MCYSFGLNGRVGVEFGELSYGDEEGKEKENKELEGVRNRGQQGSQK